MEIREILIELILVPSIKRLYQVDCENIRFGVSERNICARLAHHMENIMREYDQVHTDSPFREYYADVEYDRMGNGDQKHYENSAHRPRKMVSDLLIQKRGFGRNLLAIEMKKKGNSQKVEADRERLESLVSTDYGECETRCVHDTLLGAFIIYSPQDVIIELYENVDGKGKMTNILTFDLLKLGCF